MSTMPAMPLLTSDYLGDTMHLTLEQHGAYLKLLIVTWNNRGEPLPDDPKMICRILGIGPKKWQTLRPVLEPFFDLSDGAWHSRKLSKVVRWVEKRRELCVISGRMGGMARALKYHKTDLADAQANGIAKSKRTLKQPKPKQKEEKEKRVSYAKKHTRENGQFVHLFPELPESSPPSQPPAVRPSKSNGLELEAVAVYRELCVPAGLPDIRGLSPESRQVTLGKRLREDFGGDIRQWRDFCQRVGASPLLTGQVSRWCANFDWILKPANMVKILEGAYKDRAPPEHRSRNPQAKDLRYD